MSNMIPQYDTKLMTEVWEDADAFKTDLQASPFAGSIHYGETDRTDPLHPITYPDNVSLLYYLLYAKYGNSPIANFDITQFKYKMFSTIFQFGPTWEKKLELQEKVRGLTETEIMTGAKAIYNSALNPSTAPTTGSLEELSYINAQNTTNYKKSKLEAYSLQWGMLDDNLTARFIEKFSICFKKFVRPERPLVYVSEDEEGDE